MDFVTVLVCFCAVVMGGVVALRAQQRQRKREENALESCHEGNDNVGDIDLQDPKVARAVRAKQKLRSRDEKSALKPSIASNAPTSMPPGQKEVDRWVPFDLGLVVKEAYVEALWSNREDFHLLVEGGQTPLSLSLKTLEELAVATDRCSCDWHCVTGWSFRGVKLKGVAFSAILEKAKPREGWIGVMQRSADGYTANIYRDDLHDAFVAIGDDDGIPLSKDHGGIRLVAPSLFMWKSAKFLEAIEFLYEEEFGFWEGLGCHKRGRWAYNERWDHNASAVWSVLIYLHGLWYRLGGITAYMWIMSVAGGYLGAVVHVKMWILNKMRRNGSS